MIVSQHINLLTYKNGIMIICIYINIPIIIKFWVANASTGFNFPNLSYLGPSLTPSAHIPQSLFKFIPAIGVLSSAHVDSVTGLSGLATLLCSVVTTWLREPVMITAPVWLVQSLCSDHLGSWFLFPYRAALWYS